MTFNVEWKFLYLVHRRSCDLLRFGYEYCKKKYLWMGFARFFIRHLGLVRQYYCMSFFLPHGVWVVLLGMRLIMRLFTVAFGHVYYQMLASPNLANYFTKKIPKKKPVWCNLPSCYSFFHFCVRGVGFKSILKSVPLIFVFRSEVSMCNTSQNYFLDLVKYQLQRQCL